MKHLFLVFLLFMLWGCHRSTDDSSNPTDQLPPATTTGANTAGCLVNGKVLLPKGQNIQSGPPLSSFYQYLNGGYHFSLGFDDSSGTNLKGIGIGSDNITLEQGKTYILAKNLHNNTLINMSAYYVDFNLNSQYNTNETINGELKIAHLDQTNYIISGTFWFDAVNSNGDKVQVREGRFDVHYAP